MNLTGQAIFQKAKRFVSKAWRNSANGKACTMGLPGCDHSGTTVLCHIRKFSWAGMGQKPHDFLAFYGCASCHAKQERGECSDEDLLLALGKTLTIHYEDGRKW